MDHIKNLFRMQKSKSKINIFLTKLQNVIYMFLILWLILIPVIFKEYLTKPVFIIGTMSFGPVVFFVIILVLLKIKQDAKMMSYYKNLISEKEKDYKRLDLIHKMDNALKSISSDKIAFGIIINCIKDVFPDLSGVLLLVDSESNTVSKFEQWGEISIDDSGDLCNCLAFLTKEHQVINLDGSHQCNTRSEKSDHLCFPITVMEKMVGIIQLQQKQKDTLDILEDSVKIISNVIDQVEISLTNIELKNILREMAVRDPLTGLYNRHHMSERFKAEFEKAKRKNLCLSVLMIDVDWFKKINDTHGHDVGDQVLKEIAEIIKTSFRIYDGLFRYGGEEFLILMPETSLELALKKAEELRENVEDHVFLYQKIKMSLTISVGVAEYKPNIMNSEAILKEADEALYKAKKSGRNKVCHK